MTKKRTVILSLAVALMLIALSMAFYAYMLFQGDYGFCREVSRDEQLSRLEFVAAAEKWLGSDEGSENHASILAIYNGHEPLAQGYPVQPEDNWCAAFVSAVAIQCGMTDIIPTECGCQRQIGLWQELGCWVEDDGYTPLPGDIIYYSNSDRGLTGDCTGWSDHVGIVVGTRGRLIKVIEGNYGDTVGYHYTTVNAPKIRGYATPKY